jgi:hypothetical protein
VTAYPFMQPLYAPQPPKTWSALSIACPSPACSAPAGTACGGRCCPERVGEAVERARRGDLEPTPESARVPLADDGLASCASCRSFNKRTIGCPEHRCAAMIAGRGPCRAARTPGSMLCPVHRCTVEENGERCVKKLIYNKKCAEHAGR